MLTILRRAKVVLEKFSGIKIYRNSLPHGADCYFDIARRFGRERIKVVFDVGANVGQSALRYLDEFPRSDIYSFEPVEDTYKQLLHATRPCSRIHAYKLGMGRAAGEAQIHVNPMSRVSSIMHSRPEDHDETITLQTVTGFAQEHHLDTIDFLKVDTEGFDLEVLAGAAPLLKEQRIHFVQSECEPVGRTKEFVSLQALSEFMAEYGYGLFGVYEQQPEWDGRNVLLYWNAVFICGQLIGHSSQLP